MANIRRGSTETKFDSVTKRQNAFKQSFAEVEATTPPVTPANTEKETEGTPAKAEVQTEVKKTSVEAVKEESANNTEPPKAEKEEKKDKPKKPSVPKASIGADSSLEIYMNKKDENKKSEQRSIYFTGENIEYIKALSDSTGLPVAKVVNHIIKQYREQYNK